MKLLHIESGSPELAVMVLVLCLAGSGPGARSAFAAEPILPVPQNHGLDPKKVALGEKLFNDPRLSKNNAMACAACHVAALGGADGRAKSININGAPTKRNAPTVFNVGLNFRQFWDGRSDSLAHQLDTVLRDPNVMNTDWPEIMAKLSQDPKSAAEFRSAYPDGVQIANISDALVTYQTSLTTPNARFDRYLRGETNAISSDELKGYNLFKSYGCVACHQGMNVGGNMFQRFGVMGGRQPGKPELSPDIGRLKVTGQEPDRFVFKVPSLRNVELTAPYFHDGSAATLEQAVSTMFAYQLGRSPSPDDLGLIVKFLKTLTGELKGKPLAPPTTVLARDKPARNSLN